MAAQELLLMLTTRVRARVGTADLRDGCPAKM
jgi:hypothetical protein